MKNFEKDRNLVLLLHGLNGSPGRFDTLRPCLEQAGFPVAVFEYPNDQSIEASAKFFAAELKQLKQKQPQRAISVVTSSMGGLEARAALEDELRDPGNVNQLIMAAPPTHGSSLARFAFGLEVWEHVAKGSRNPVRCMYGAIEDGLGEAAEDLVPGSIFLTKLNRRPRNPSIRYTILLGTAGVLSEEALPMLRDKLDLVRDRNRFCRFFGKKLNGYLSDMDELVIGKGDGAVSVVRGKLEGVKDIVLVPADHGSMFLDSPKEDAHSPRAIILNRLQSLDR